MQKPKIIDAEFTVIESCKTLVPLNRSVRRPNWLLIAYEELVDYPGSWGLLLLLFMALGHLPF